MFYSTFRSITVCVASTRWSDCVCTVASGKHHCRVLYQSPCQFVRRWSGWHIVGECTRLIRSL